MATFRSSRFSVSATRRSSAVLSIALAITGVAVAVATPILTRTVLAASPVYDAPLAIASDCSADVTSSLTSWIASLPSGSTAQLRSGGCYRVEGTIELRDRSGLVIEGNGATLRATTTGGSHRAHLRFIYGSDLAVHNLTLVGANSDGGTAAAYHDDLQYQNGIELRGVSGAIISGVKVHNVYGDCFYLGVGYDSTTWSRDLVVRDSECLRNGRQGVALTATENVVIAGNRFDQIGLIGVDIEPNGGTDGVRNVLVTGNSFGTGRQWFFAAVSYSGSGVVDNVTVDGNSVSGRSLSIKVEPALTQRWTRIAVTNNTSNKAEYYNGNGSVMDIYGVDGLVVAGNSQPGAGSDQVLVSATNSCSVALASNSFPGGGADLRSAGSYSCPVETATAPTTTTTAPTTTTTTATDPTSTEPVAAAAPGVGRTKAPGQQKKPR